MSLEETDDIIIGLAKKYGKIKECIDVKKEQCLEEVPSHSADEAEPLRLKNTCDKDGFSSRELLERIEKVIGDAVSRTDTTCDNLNFILEHKHDVVENTSDQCLPIPYRYHESAMQYFDIMQKLAKQMETDEEPSSLQCLDWKKMMKNLQHTKSVMQHKDMQIVKQLKIITHMLRGTLVTEEIKTVRSITRSSDEESD